MLQKSLKGGHLQIPKYVKDYSDHSMLSNSVIIVTKKSLKTNKLIQREMNRNGDLKSLVAIYKHTGKHFPIMEIQIQGAVLISR